MDDQFDKQSISDLLARARVAQKIAESYSQERVDRLAAAVVYCLSRYETADTIAKIALEETQMGRYDSKFDKLAKKVPGCFYDVIDQKTVGIVERIPEKGLIRIAKPVGVIAALIPSTNPEATPVFKGMLALRARNAIIFAPHPKSVKTTKLVVDIMRDVLVKNDAPADIFICIDKPTKALSAELMRQCDLTMATGSSDMVRAAYSSGKPAYGVGVGNAVVVIDETADLADAAHKIMLGKTGDNASGCSAENSMVIQANIYDTFLAQLVSEGGYLANAEEKQRVQNVIWVDGHLNREAVAKSAETVARLAGISLPEGTRFIIVEETGVGKEYPFSGEKMSLVITAYKYNDFGEAVELVNEITHYSGFGHSCAIHSTNQEHIEWLALCTYTTKVNVRQPNGQANGGSWNNYLPFTFSLGCGTWGGNIISENVSQKHYLNTTWVDEPVERKIPSDEEIYKDLLVGMII